MHQLREVTGVNKYWVGNKPYTATYTQKFDFDDAGNMMHKISSANVRPKYVIGSDLNYDFEYEYYKGYAHRLEHAGKMYYQYDANGNLLVERYNGHAPVTANNAVVTNEGSLYSTDYGFGLANDSGAASKTVYQRTYSWNERNLMSSSDDGTLLVNYRYGADGQRALKSTTNSKTFYFNSMWTAKTDSVGLRQSKHIYVGESRIATKCNYQACNDEDAENPGDGNLNYEANNIYWYHSDHLGSAQFVTDTDGQEHECLEYTPYGELWIERTTTGLEKLPYRFTGKEFDEETGLYYYGARYLDPKYSRWLSADPALGECIPGAPVSEEARNRNGNLPGMGGVFNTVNFALYHYAGNNPVKYLDPDGRDVHNTSGHTIIVKPNTGPFVILEAGDDYVGEQDGIITADGTVFKCADDADVTVSMNKDGNYIFTGGEEENASGNKIKVAVNATRILIRESRFFLEEQDLFGRYRLDYSDRADNNKFPNKWAIGEQDIDHDNDRDSEPITGTILPDTKKNKDNSPVKPNDVEKHWNDLRNKGVSE